MKIIDLLNKIANGEEVPSKVKYFDLIYEFCDKCKQYEFNDGETRIKLLEEIGLLDDEVEIIEDTSKKIKKIEKWFAMNVDEFLPQRIDEYNLTTANIVEKLNEIIDYINEGKNV